MKERWNVESVIFSRWMASMVVHKHPVDAEKSAVGDHDQLSALLTSLDGTANAVVQIGSILLIKVDGTPVVINLTPQELAELEREPHLFRSPCEVLDVLQNLRKGLAQSDELPAV